MIQTAEKKGDGTERSRFEEKDQTTEEQEVIARSTRFE